MLDARGRSKTGCLTCKNRRKKCDETRPVCQRCTRANMECLGYSYLDNPVRKPRKPRTVKSPVFAPPDPPPAVAGPSQPPAHGFAAHAPQTAYDPPYPPMHPPLPNDRLIVGEALPLIGTIGQYMNPITGPAPSGVPNIGPPPAQPIPVPHDASSSYPLWWGGSSGPAGTSPEAYYEGANRYTAAPSKVSLLGSSVDDPRSRLTQDGPEGLVSWRTSFYRSEAGFGSFVSLATSSHGSVGTSNPEPDDGSSVTSDDSEAEGMASLLKSTLALDRNASGNALPFVLSSYFRWVMRTMFEPLTIAHWMKEFIILRYATSDDSRRGTLLAATVLDSLDKTPGVTFDQIPAMIALDRRTQNKLLTLGPGQDQSVCLHVDHNLEVLYDVQEMVLIQCRLRPMSYEFTILADLARVYQVVCPNPAGARYNLLAQLLHPNPTLRHFPAMDILLGLCTSRPMYLRYDATYPSDVSELRGIGLQRVHGIPDVFLFTLGRMNVLREEFGSNVDHRLVQEMEAVIDGFQSVLDESPDPHLRLMRLMVHEAWKQVMYIYLYMGLRGVSSDDLRVESALKKFMKLVNRVKPGRRPDFFLIAPLMVAGMAARRPRDRFVIQQRMTSVHECAQLATSRNDCIRMLHEVWAMSESEGRPAVWADLQTARLMVTSDV